MDIALVIELGKLLGHPLAQRRKDRRAWNTIATSLAEQYGWIGKDRFDRLLRHPQVRSALQASRRHQKKPDIDLIARVLQEDAKEGGTDVDDQHARKAADQFATEFFTRFVTDHIALSMEVRGLVVDLQEKTRQGSSLPLTIHQQVVQTMLSELEQQIKRMLDHASELMERSNYRDAALALQRIAELPNGRG